LTPGVIEVGFEPPPSAWLEVTQRRIDEFAAATDDFQPIHVDPDAAAEGPFGTTVAHGFLTLSLIVPFWYEVAPRTGARVAINYGVNKVRFPAPVPAGSRIRGRFRVETVEEVAGGVRATLAATVEREGDEKPACVAELVLLLLR
jgi:acyl dehydratase